MSRTEFENFWPNLLQAFIHYNLVYNNLDYSMAENFPLDDIRNFLDWYYYEE